MLPFLCLVVFLVAAEAGVIKTDVALGSGEVRGKRSDDGGPLEAVVQQLTQQVNSLTAQLNQQVNEVSVLKAKTLNLEKSVAFHAWSNHNPIHAAAGAILVLDHVATNVGNAYDSLTGVFTAPLSGLYDFQLISIMAYGPENHGLVHGYIYVDGVIMGSTIADSVHGRYSQSTVRAIVHVNNGQKVFVKNIDNFDANYYSDPSSPYTTFSGVLLKAD